jgi:thiamine-phosphate pyrophosphorylase
MKDIGKLHVLTDIVVQTRFSHAELAERAVAGGADTIQFRQKYGSTKSMIATACEIREICRRAGATFIVNDRLDLALACEADGVHLGQDDFPIALARDILGKDRIIGGSAATLEEALRCYSDGADYVGFGPVYPTSSKDDAGPSVGLVALEKMVTALPIPVVAIGGITAANTGEVMATGSWGIAVISSVCCQDDPEGAVKELRRIVFRQGP